MRMENRFETERQRQSRRFWGQFCDYLRQRGSQLESLEPMESDKEHYRDFPIGVPGVAVRARQQKRQGTRDGRGLSAAFILRGCNRTEESRLLQKQQVGIENEYGESLSWYAVKKEICANVATMDVDVTDETDWPNQHEWLATKLEKLVEVFRPRILKLR